MRCVVVFVSVSDDVRTLSLVIRNNSYNHR